MKTNHLSAYLSFLAFSIAIISIALQINPFWQTDKYQLFERTGFNQSSNDNRGSGRIQL